MLDRIPAPDTRASDQPAGEEARARALIGQAAARLAELNRAVAPTFVAQLFARAVPEDLLRYGAGDLARIAERAWAFIAERWPGKPKLRFETQALKEAADAGAIGLIEVLNDDMPFLVDSVLAELNERGLRPDLVVHP